MKWKKLPKRFLLASSLALAACQGVPAPKGEGCVAFVKEGKCTNLCFDLENDFDPETGDVKKDAKARREPCDVSYFHRRVNFDPDSAASLKAYALKVKSRCEAK